MFSIGSASGNIPANFQRPLSRLAGGLRVCEVDESGCVPELVVENPLDSGAALRRRGARRREAEPHSERQRHRRGEVDAADPRLLRRAGALVAAVGVLRRGKPRFACRASAPEGRGAGRSRSRGEFHRARSGTRFTSARWSCASPHPPGASSDLYRARAGDLRALETRSPRSPVSAAPSSGSGAICASTRSRGPMPSPASGRSSARATCSTRSSVSTGSRRRSRSSRPSSQTSATRWSRGSRPSGSGRTSACAATG
jgi:hypothetical protein